MAKSKVLEKLEGIELKKNRLEMQKAKLLQKERKIETKTFVEIGKLAKIAQIHEMDKEKLLGAFLKIHADSFDEELVKHWIDLAQERSRRVATKEKHMIVVKVTDFPVPEYVQNNLKKLGMGWIEVRGEYYGKAIRQDVEDALGTYEAEVLIAE